MLRYPSRRMILVLFATIGLVAAVTLLDRLRSATAVRHEVRSISDSREVALQLEFLRFQASAARLTGRMRLYTRLQGRLSWDHVDRYRLDRVSLTLTTPYQRGVATEHLGGSIAWITPVDITVVNQFGTGEVELRAEPNRSSFWYPFDSYTASFAPSLRRDFNPDATGDLDLAIDEMVMDLSAPGLAITHDSKFWDGDLPGLTSFRIDFARPLATRLLFVLLTGLSVVWLIWIATRCDAAAMLQQVVGVFVAAWGWRSVFSASGDATLPAILGLVDMTFLTVSLSAVVLLLSRWRQVETSPT